MKIKERDKAKEKIAEFRKLVLNTINLLFVQLNKYNYHVLYLEINILIMDLLVKNWFEISKNVGALCAKVMKVCRPTVYIFAYMEKFVWVIKICGLLI